MSLDVYLSIPCVRSQPDPDRIFIREDGQTKAITRAEWDERFPDREPFTFEATDTSEDVFDYNITHNLGQMAAAAGIYEALWRPEEIGITKAAQLVEPLSTGLDTLRAGKSEFEKLNPSNGWGDYNGLVKFVECYLQACMVFPEAEVRASR